MTHTLKRRAFTLIELLVVISIIALLISLLLPALSSARKTAQSASCLSNLRQIGIATYTYAQDSDGKLPVGVARNWNGVTGDYAGWWTVLNPYLGGQGDSVNSTNSGDPDTETVSDALLCAGAPVPGGVVHFSSNPVAIWRYNEASKFPQLNLNTLKAPSDLFLIVDGSQRLSDGKANSVAFMMDSGAAFWAPYMTGGMSSTARQTVWANGLNTDGNSTPPYSDIRWRHGGTTLNLNFADGHAANYGQGILIRNNIIPAGWKAKS